MNTLQKVALPLLVILLCSVIDLKACDYCGVFMGIRPNERSSRIELWLRYRNYQGYVRSPLPNFQPQPHPFFRQSHDPSLHQNSDDKPIAYRSDDRNRFLTYEMRGTFFINPRWSVMAVLPYHQNSLRIENNTQTGGGLGDISLLLNHFLVRSIDKKVKCNILLHGGVKLPTGYYVHNAEQFASQSHLQAGTGSYDFITGTTASFRVKNWGTATNLLYKINTPNYLGYRFANSINLTHSFFYDYNYNRRNKAFHLFPTAGVYYENSNGEFLNKRYQSGTGGQIWFGTVGIDGQLGETNRWGFTTSLQLPIWQDLLGVQLGSGGRLIVGLQYNLTSTD